MKIVVVEKGRFVFADADRPKAGRDHLVVKPAAFSLNRGEVNYGRYIAPDKAHLGWDFAGVVVEAAEEGGPAVGTRVVGYIERRAWGEYVPVPIRQVAVLPDHVGFSAAACLPVAGLTALYAVASHGDVLARKVLITGATGGVGHFAIPLAKLMGAEVWATVRDRQQAERVRGYGADHVIDVGSGFDGIRDNGRYDLIVDAVGGPILGACLNAIAPDGACVVIGVSGDTKTTFDSFDFFVTGGVRVYDQMLFRDMMKRELPSVGLSRLVKLLADGRLAPDISVERPWQDIDAVAQDLLDRRFSGKAVLTV